jgi:uncharacterized phage-associated protein
MNLQAKIGNMMIYLSSKISELHLTKLIKLFYLIDEESVREVGAPMTWLEYKVWRMGPVTEELYFGIKNCSPIYGNYVSFYRSYYNENGIVIKACKEFDRSEFSRVDIEIMDEIIYKYGGKSSEELIDILHQKGTLWSDIADQHGLKEAFRLEKLNKTDHVIDLKQLITDEFDLAYYNDVQRMMSL